MEKHIHKMGLSFIGLFFLHISGSMAQTSSLSISSAEVDPNATAILEVGLNVSGTAPAGLEFAITWSPALISGISIAPGPAAIAAVKTLSCASGSGAVSCMLTGLNTNPIGSGVVAWLNATVVPGITTASIQPATSIGVDSGGNGLTMASGVGGTIIVSSLLPLTCSPAALNAGTISTCTVTLTQAAPTGGSSVTVASNNTLLTVPSLVTVPAGASTATFAASAAASIANNQTATLTATFGGSSKTAAITLAGQALVSGLACSPIRIESNTSSTCTVTLNQTAPTGGLIVTVAGNYRALSVPSSVTVPAGATTSSFRAKAGPFETSETVAITASLDGSFAVASLTLTGTGLREHITGIPGSETGHKAAPSLSCSPGALAVDSVVNCELRVATSSESVPVQLHSSSEEVMIPAVVTTRRNQSSLTFQAATGAVSKQQQVSITATFGAATAEDTILLMASTGPVLRVPGRQIAKVGTLISFTASATDSSGLPVQLGAAAVPAGAAFDSETGVFEWRPKPSQAGEYRIAFTATNSARQSSTAEVNLEVDAGLPVVSGTPSPCSPGGIATLNGKWLGASGSRFQDPTGESFSLGGTSVEVNGQSVPVLYNSADRVDFLCPSVGVATGGQLSVKVTSRFGSIQPVPMKMVAASPEILFMKDSTQRQGLIWFFGTSDLAMERNFRVPSHPAQPGDLLEILATGLGSTADLSPGMLLVKLSDVYVGVESVHAVPGCAGVFSIEVRVPAAIAFGTVPMQLQVTTPDGHLFAGNSVTAAFEAARY